MVYAKRRYKRFKKKLSEFGKDKNKSKLKLNKVDDDFQTTVPSVYNEGKTRAYKFEVED